MVGSVGVMATGMGRRAGWVARLRLMVLTMSVRAVGFGGEEAVVCFLRGGSWEGSLRWVELGWVMLTSVDRRRGLGRMGGG